MQRVIGLLLAVTLVWLSVAPGAQAQSDAPTAVGTPVYLPFVVDGASTPAQTTPPEATEADELTEDAAPTLIVRIYFDSHELLHELTHEFDVLEQPTTDGYVTALVNQEEWERLQAEGYRAEIDTAQTEQLAGALAHLRQAQVQSAALDTIPGYSCYRTVEETYSTMQGLATAHPQLATWSDIGDSWEKITPGGKAGYDLFVLKLTNSLIPGPKPKFLLIAAIHAREYTTAELATRFAEDLVAKYNVDPDVTWLLNYFEIHIVPQLNPDGRKMAEAGQLWRKNTDNNDGCSSSSSWGTDLNRNSSFKWNTGGSSSNACNETYRGPSAASEPETAAIEAYAATIFPDQRGPADSDPAPATTEGVFISLHSYGRLVLYPWGYTTTAAPNSVALQTLGRKFGYFNSYQVCNGPACLYGTSGTTDDFTYGAFGVASYTIELGNSFFEQCTAFQSTILPANLPALYYAAKAARRPYQNPAGPDALNVAVSAATVTAGTPVQLTATINDTRYNSNGWGTEPTQAIQAARYTIDAPAWTGATAIPMNAVDGAFNNTTEAVAATVDTSGLAVGRHTLFVEGQDNAGNWGVLSSAFLTISDGSATPTPTPTATPTATPTPLPGGATVYVSSTTDGTVGGVTFADEDIIAHNVNANSWSLYFDGSDVGIAVDVDAFTILANGSLLLSFDAATSLAGLGTIDDSDLVRFAPTSLGANTAGSFSIYFDGSDVGLTTTNEDIDGVGIAPDGRLLISTLGAVSVTGVSAADTDLLAFSATALGTTTSGAWTLYVDGSDVGLTDNSTEDLRGIWVASGGQLYLSTAGTFSVTGTNGGGDDVFVCTPTSLGSTTACTFGPGLYWAGNLYGFGAEILDGLAIKP